MKRLTTYKLFEFAKPSSEMLDKELLNIIYDLQSDIKKDHILLKKIQDLIKQGADINFQDKDGDTILINAVRTHIKEVVKIILDAGPDINKQNKFGETALLQAAGDTYIDSKNILKMLIDAGANINIKNSYGNTALNRAAFHLADYDIITLIEAGADVSNENKDGHNFICNYTYAIIKYNGNYNFLNSFKFQKLLLEKEPAFIEVLIEEGVRINPKIKIEFPHLFAGMDLNLL